MSPRGSFLFMRSPYPMSPIPERERLYKDSELGDATDGDLEGPKAEPITASTKSLYEVPASNVDAPSDTDSQLHCSHRPTSPPIRLQGRSISPGDRLSPMQSTARQTPLKSRSSPSKKHSNERRYSGDVEEEVQDLQHVASDLKAINEQLAARLDRLINKLEIYHFPTCPNLHGRTADPQRTHCGHIICLSCISKWLRDNDSCPCCHEYIQREDLTPVRVPWTQNLSLIHSDVQGRTQSELYHNQSQGQYAEQSFSGQASGASSRRNSHDSRNLETDHGRRRHVSDASEKSIARNYLDLYRSLDDECEC